MDKEVRALRQSLADQGIELTPAETASIYPQARRVLEISQQNPLELAAAVQAAQLSPEDAATVSELLLFAKELQEGRR